MSVSNTSGKAVWKSVPCWHNCGGGCLIKALVKDGEIVRTKTDDTHPDSWEHLQSRSCPMGHAVRQQVFGEGRLKYPMKRKHWAPGDPHGELRGIDEWERISWDEALGYIADELKKAKELHGNESILYLNLFNLEGYLGQVLSAFGGYVDTAGTQSAGSFSLTGPACGFRSSEGNDRFDLSNSDYIVLYGMNSAWCAFSNSSMYLKKAKENGAKFVFVGPEYSATAGFVNAEWIPVRPAGDTALLLGVAFTMISNDDDGSYIDWDFLNRCTVGFDAQHMPDDARETENFHDYVLGIYDGIPKTPEWASEICGTPVELIERFAEILAQENAVSIHSNAAPARNKGAENFPQLLMTVAAMGGHFGKPGHGCTYPEWFSTFNKGGMAVVTPPAGLPTVFTSAGNPVDVVLGLEHIWDGVVDGQAIDVGGLYPDGAGVAMHAPIKRDLDIHVIVSDHNNFLSTQPNINKGIEAFRKVDFAFALAYTMKMDAMYSDIVLPITTRLERRQNYTHAMWTDKEATFAYDKLFEPMFECWSDREIAEGIATQLGLDYDQINPLSDDQLWFNQLTSAMVMPADGVPMPVCSVTQEDLDKYGVEGVPHEGIMPLAEFIEKGVYRVKRQEGDAFHRIAYQAFREDPTSNPLMTQSGKLEIYCQKKSDMYDMIDGFFGGEGSDNYLKVSPLPKYLRAPLTYEDSFIDWEAKVRGSYPVQITHIHYPRRVHTEFDDLPWLREALVNPVFINREDAAERGISQDDVIRVFNEYGAFLRPAAVTRTVMPGVIIVPHGARPRIDRETDIDLAGADNILTASDKATNPLVQTWNTNLCQYEKYDGPIELEPDCEVAPMVPLAD